MAELLNCPFCGGEAALQEHVLHGYYSTYGVICMNCNAQTRQSLSHKKVAERIWNRRYDSEVDDDRN